MFVQGKCYKCGGFLAVDDTQDASVCPFCNKAFIVSKAIASLKDSSSHSDHGRKATFSSNTDFYIERSVLVRFNGYIERDVKIPDGISAIGEGAFQGMNNIESVHIPVGVVKIGAGAFSGCKNLKSLNIPEGVDCIDRDVFNGCTSLRSLKLPDSVKHLEAGAFAGCTSLESVNIPDKIEVIPWKAFAGCTSLKRIIIPKRVRTIEDCAFSDCTGLENIKFECMYHDGNVSHGVTRIGMYAFKNCKSLENADLPETVEFIGNQAFRGCSKFEKLTIPKSVKTIYALAFADCTELEHVVISKGTELYKGSNPYKYGKYASTFYNCPKLLNVSDENFQKHWWAYPAYTKAKEPENIKNGRCRYCGGKFKGVMNKICTGCKREKDY